MSVRNGDKARFGKEQKKKLLRRKNTLAVRQSLEKTAPGTTGVQAPEPVSTTLLESDARGQESADSPASS